jgi:O-antigen ligase
MVLQKNAERAYFIFLYAFAALLPTFFFIAPILIVLIGLSWLALIHKQSFNNIKNAPKIVWVFIIFYVLHVLSYFISENKQQASFELEQKLGFLLLPIFVGSGPVIDNKRLSNLFIFYIFGISAVAITCFTNAGIIWYKSHTYNQFFYHQLVHIFSANAIYNSVYTLFSLSLLMLYNWPGSGIFKNKILYTLLFIIQIIFLLLLSSKTVILLFALILVPLYIMKINKQHKITWVQLTPFAFITFLLALVLFTNNPIKTRYKQITKYNQTSYWIPEKENQQQQFNHLTIRLFLWKIAIENIIENKLYLYGSGSGDVQDLQKKKILIYEKRFDPDRNTNQLCDLNIHNQILQTFFMLGFVGLLIVIYILITPFFWTSNDGIKNIIIVFNLSYIFLAMQESVFQTQAGVIYYLFMYFIFYNYCSNNVKKEVVY